MEKQWTSMASFRGSRFHAIRERERYNPRRLIDIDEFSNIASMRNSQRKKEEELQGEETQLD